MTNPRPHSTEAMAALRDLSDHDLILNLYLTVLMAISVSDSQPENVELSVTRMTDTEDTPEQVATLADLMSAVETRLGISVVEEVEEMRLQ